MKRHTTTSLLVAFVLVAGSAVLLTACSRAGDTPAQGTPVAEVAQQAAYTQEQASTDPPASAAGTDPFSTFTPKDPFIQQALPEETPPPVVTTVPAQTPTTGPSGGATTTTFYWTTTTRPPATTTTVRPTTTTTTPHLHTLRILSVATVSGAPAVTFRVDDTTYKDRRVGDVVSTTWGQVRIVDISIAGKVVTLLHGSETLVLAVGQSTYE